MLINFLYGLPTMAVCLFLQSLMLIRAIDYYRRHEKSLNSPSVWQSLAVVNGVMVMLVIGNLAQVAAWGLLFNLLDEFESFSVAFYHSAVNFASLGYGDIVMSEEHRLLGALEAINGVIMIGVTTAILMSFFQDALKRTYQARNG
jgi:hypothetical protein